MAGQQVIVSVLSNNSKFQKGMSEVASTASTTFAGIAKVAGAGLIAAGAAVVALTTKVVKATADWEQAAGGVEAVFGSIAPSVMKASEAAYKMGMSSEQFLSSQAKLGALMKGNGLSAAQAWERSEQLQVRALDAATAMGISAEDANRAIEGMAKGNFTMMDNLGVAMNDTTLKAYALEKGMDYTTTADKNAVAFEYFMDKTQDYAGNAAAEASKTITGSFGMLNASWNDLLAGMGRSDADIKKLVQNVGDSIKAVVSNIMPVVQSVVSTLPTILATLVPIVLALVPDLLSAGVELINSLISGIVSALPGLVAQAVPILLQFVQAILGQLPMILDAGIKVLLAIVDGITKAIPKLIPVTVDTVLKIVDTLVKNLPKIINAGITLIVTLALALIDALPKLAQKVPQIIIQIVTTLIDNIDKIIDAGVTLLIALVENLPAIIKGVVAAIPKIITAIVEALKKAGPKIIDAGGRLIEGIWRGMSDKFGWIKNKISGFAKDVEKWFKGFFGIASPSKVMRNLGKFLPQGLGLGVDDGTGYATRAMSKLSDAVQNAFDPTLSMDVDSAHGTAGGVYYSFDGGIHFEAADAAEAGVLEAFTTMARRKLRAA